MPGVRDASPRRVRYSWVPVALPGVRAPVGALPERAWGAGVRGQASVRGVSELLGYAEWRARYIVFCQRCEADTLPLRDGTCGFCSDKIAAPEPISSAPVGGSCAVCNRELPLARPSNVEKQRFCSDTCRKRAYRARVMGTPFPLPSVECGGCGKPFSPSRVGRKYCCRSCKNRANWASRKQAA